MTGGLDRPFADGERAELIGELSDALDEIYRLRRVLAYEALVTEAHLTYKSFPKSRRAVAEDSSTRMKAAARGRVRPAYGGVASWAFDSAMREAGAPETLTRAAFHAERNPR